MELTVVLESVVSEAEVDSVADSVGVLLDSASKLVSVAVSEAEEELDELDEPSTGVASSPHSSAADETEFP